MPLRLLIQGSRFDPVGRNPEDVRRIGYGLDITGSESTLGLLNLHLLADQIIPLCMVCHEDAFQIEILCLRAKCTHLKLVTAARALGKTGLPTAEAGGTVALTALRGEGSADR
jgi:hypothetical protein